MTQALTWKLHLVGYILATTMAGYAYYNLIIAPQNEITELKQIVQKQKELPTKVVNSINAADANRTQEEIDEEKQYKDINIFDYGTIVF